MENTFVMADRMTAEQRRRCMSRIRSTDTKPEMIVRRWLWSHGYRYGLHNKKLPGKPDIVLRKHKTVVLVNGCFWHGHNVNQLPEGELTNSECCKIPQSNRRFWLDKINRNRGRDQMNMSLLKAIGWKVIVVWECELHGSRRQSTLDGLLEQLSSQQCYSTTTENVAVAAEPITIYGSSPSDNLNP